MYRRSFEKLLVGGGVGAGILLNSSSRKYPVVVKKSQQGGVSFEGFG